MMGTLLGRSEQMEQVFLLLKGVLFSYIIMGIIQQARNILKNILYQNTYQCQPLIKNIVDYNFNCNINKIMNIDQLKLQNKKLKELQASCKDQLQKLKETGKGHQAEIDTLLKFNQRLLGIIENQFNSATKNKISSDLQIITQANQASTDLSNHPMFKNKLGGAGAASGATGPPKLASGGFEQQDMEGFEQEEEEEIYNQERQNSSPVIKTSEVPPTKQATKLNNVFDKYHKKMEESINLTSSIPNSDPASPIQPGSEPVVFPPPTKQSQPQMQIQSHPPPQLQQLKEMIKEYKQEFVQNSAEYEQICVIIHNDLLKDLEEFKKIRQESHDFYSEKMVNVNKLKQEIKRFRPVNELVRIMKKLNVPQATERVLQQQIINKHI